MSGYLAGSRLKIVYYRPKMSGKICAPVENALAQDVRDLAGDLCLFCLENKMLSLAAPQVGLNLQLAVIKLPDGRFDTLINPRIVNLGARDLLETETCVALPGAAPRIWRSEVVCLRSDPDSGQIRTYKGGLARIVLHEIDHLNGCFILDRCQTPGRAAALQAYTQWLKSTARER